MAAQKNTRASIQVIGRMTNLLDVLAAHDQPVALKQLAAETGLHPSTAHRILAVMVANRFAERDEPGIYRLGARLVELGNLATSRISLQQKTAPYPLALQCLPEKSAE